MALNAIKVILKSILQLLEALVDKEARTEVMHLVLLRSLAATF